MMGRAAVSGHRCESAATLAMKRRADHHHHADDEEADDANRAGVLGDLFTDVVGGLGEGDEEEHAESVDGQPSAMSLVSVSSG